MQKSERRLRGSRRASSAGSFFVPARIFPCHPERSEGPMYSVCSAHILPPGLENLRAIPAFASHLCNQTSNLCPAFLTFLCTTCANVAPPQLASPPPSPRSSPNPAPRARFARALNFIFIYPLCSSFAPEFHWLHQSCGIDLNSFSAYIHTTHRTTKRELLGRKLSQW